MRLFGLTASCLTSPDPRSTYILILLIVAASPARLSEITGRGRVMQGKAGEDLTSTWNHLLLNKYCTSLTDIIQPLKHWLLLDK